MRERSEELQREQGEDASALVDPVFLKELRSQMLKFAVLQLQDEQQAEDAVQEALVGALKNARSFGRRSALKTWVFAILKNKITDSLRHKHKLVSAGDLVPERDDDKDPMEMLFNQTGHWHADERPAKWQHPDNELENQHFWRTFETCLNNLPEKQSRFFMMREFLELETGEICENEGITVSNLHVILYRARLRLRECLENRWFLEEGRS
ncbi:RNA polymerase factor sigma-70 [Marinobacterium arenosum]|uniref:RNA polymerase factor sigma-70 n=1 Tax=Marinobacterium arenosum TaxID=2862496 RepID=UPI001C9689BD|nr:RNA polymerase factor sigma-70 [Marinobacterium arenosum]MBY4676994.1 RNA polymerase factor sigma-70 [Marinobacterium arenosum]